MKHPLFSAQFLGFETSFAAHTLASCVVRTRVGRSSAHIVSHLLRILLEELLLPLLELGVGDQHEALTPFTSVLSCKTPAKLAWWHELVAYPALPAVPDQTGRHRLGFGFVCLVFVDV